MYPFTCPRIYGVGYNLILFHDIISHLERIINTQDHIHSVPKQVAVQYLQQQQNETPQHYIARPLTAADAIILLCSSQGQNF